MSGRVDPKKLARAIETELERTGSPERAASEKRYLKSDLDFLGATLADIRRVARQAAKGAGSRRRRRPGRGPLERPVLRTPHGRGAHPGAPRRRAAIRGPQADRSSSAWSSRMS